MHGHRDLPADRRGRLARAIQSAESTAAVIQAAAPSAIALPRLIVATYLPPRRLTANVHHCVLVVKRQDRGITIRTFDHHGPSPCGKRHALDRGRVERR